MLIEPTMTNLLEINEKIINLKNEYSLIQVTSSTELKRSFYNLQLNILLSFYYHACSLVLWNIFAKNKDAFSSNTYNLLLFNMANSFKDQESINNLKNGDNRSILIDSWSMFETTITELCEKYISGESLVDFLADSENYRKAENIVGSKLNKEERSKLESKFRYKRLSAQSIDRRYKKLFEIFGEDENAKNFEEEFDFLKFYQKLRNCMHHNFIYLNKEDYSYPFEGIMIEFTNGKPVSFNPDVPYDFFFKLTLQLIEVTKGLFDLIDSKEKI